MGVPDPPIRVPVEARQHYRRLVQTWLIGAAAGARSCR
jgi:hypothetical protein